MRQANTPPGRLMSKALLQVLDADEESRLMRFFRRRLKNREDAADAMQETVLRALEVSHATLIDNPQAYLFQIARSVARLTAIRQSRERPLFAPYEAGFAVACEEPGQERIVAGRQHLILMARAIEALPSTLKDVLILRDVEGVEAREVCELLKITETNLYVRLHRARERVRTAVEGYLEGRTPMV